MRAGLTLPNRGVLFGVTTVDLMLDMKPACMAVFAKTHNSIEQSLDLNQTRSICLPYLVQHYPLPIMIL